MSSNDYYYGGQRPPAADSPSPAPYYNASYGPTPPPQQPTPASSYHPGYPPSGPSHGYDSRQQHTGPSPFDTVFDDNAYPYNSRNATPAASTGDIAHQNPYDTSYKSQGAPRPYHEDIPLQDRAKDVETSDHIYDASGQPKRQKSRKVRFGELGMFGADRKRIPWVVYLLTTVQIAVFIGEIVKNGKMNSRIDSVMTLTLAT